MNRNGDVPAVEVRGLRKWIGGGDAVAGASFVVPQGSVFGLLGPNGAGKSTTLRCLLGLWRPDEGVCRVFGEDSRELSRATRLRIGTLSEEPFPYGELPLSEALEFVASLVDRWDPVFVEGLARRMGVDLGRPLAALSVGQRRRAELFLALAPDPDLLVLDDPWLGVDARARRDFLLVTLEAARERGKTILFTSHILGDVERIADRIAFLKQGRVRLAGELDEVKSRVAILEFRGGPGFPLVPGDVVVPGELSREFDGETLSVTTEAFRPGLADALENRHGPVEVRHLNLEQIFVLFAGDDAAPALEPEATA